MPDRGNAELWERTIGCRRMQGCAHSSRASRSAESFGCKLTGQALHLMVQATPAAGVRRDSPTVSADGMTVRTQEARRQSAPGNYAAIRSAPSCSITSRKATSGERHMVR